MSEKSPQKVPKFRVGVDIGGTFTDIVFLGSEGSIATKKVPSTPDDYSRAIMAGLQEILQELNLSPTAVTGVVHATTVATNAILEGKGAKTALITTKGFRDVLEMRRIRIPELYNLFYERPAPLVPRRLRFEVDERLGPQGEVWRPLDEETVGNAVSRIRKAGVEALAVCLLHSYANPSHELRVCEIARDALPGVYVMSSVEMLPEIREYERTSTTVISAYIGPLVQNYLGSLLEQLRSIGLGGSLQILQSGGGAMTAEEAVRKPAHIVESGPAGGVIGAAWMAKRVGCENVITLDMGGTTAKAAMIENGLITKTSEYEVGAGINVSSRLVKGRGYALKLPFIDISEIGAGAGSIVSVDESGLPHVGPQSAGAVPGPVCYDAGGREPTYTDAAVVLGYLNPGHLAGGKVKLNAEKARQVLEREVAKPMGKALLETAYDVHALACATMLRAVKAISTYRGRDPRDFVLFAFGGGGPMVAAEIAKSLRMKRVLVPPSPGLFSALGLLCSNIEHSFVQTHVCKAGDISSAELKDLFAGIEDQARAVLAREGYGPERIMLSRFADMRYCGQVFELTVPAGGGDLGLPEVADMVEAFGREHEQTYGHRAIDDPVELVNLRIVGKGISTGSASYDPGAVMAAGATVQTDQVAERAAYFGPRYGNLSTPVIGRGRLAGQTIPGPLIVEEDDATCIVPPDCAATLDSWGNIVIRPDYPD